MNLKKLIAAIAAAAIALSMAACNNADHTRAGGDITTADVEHLEAIAEEQKKEAEAEKEAAKESENDSEEIEEVWTVDFISDREGGTVRVPDSINTIVSTAPSVTEILVGLGLGSKIIAADMYSADVEGIDPAICTLDFYNLNIEELVALEPDLVIISGMSMGGAEDPYTSLKDVGVNVIYVPTSNSISAVKLDIEFLAGYTKTMAAGSELISEIDRVVDGINSITAVSSFATKKKVYFEIGAAPYLYSCGSGTFIDEVITLIGAENIYSSEEGWISNSEESVIAADPDVILTNVYYEGYDFNEIKTRAGWEGISAVQNGQVYSVDANATGRPSQHIVKGIREIALAVYPGVFDEVFE